MDTNARRRKIRKVVEDNLQEIYNHDVSMYTDSPKVVIALSEFEELALERLQLLRIIEQAGLKGHKLFSEDWKNTIKEDLSKNGLKRYIRLISGYCSQTEQDFQSRRADHISHYILRLAYCRSEDLRRWFLSREMEWFKLKFLALNQQGITRFMQNNNLTYEPISHQEKDTVKNELIISTPGLTDVSCDAIDFYKVPFVEVVPLVKNRRVYVLKGFSYIPISDLVVCIQSKFRASLSEALNICNHRLPSLDDDRLNSLLSNLHNSYTGREYTVQNDREGIDPACLDSYSKQHYPLCMRSIHEVLRSTHHLRHFSRLQYGLFLKGIGLLYDDAMEFWRQEFTKTMDPGKFEKDHMYNIRHQYGKAGSMTNYTPYSCIKIITSNVGTGDHHGCPFKHWDASVLKQRLVDNGVGAEGVTSVLEMATSGHYQIACSRYFEFIHGQAPTTTITHPNQYFEESMNLSKEKSKKH